MSAESPDTVRQVYERLKATTTLPSPTGVALHLLELARDEDTSITEIATAVEADPAIAARVLLLVNSPLAGTARKIASVSRAVALLGMRPVTSLALSFSPVSNHRSGPRAGFDYELFWSESLGQGVAARNLTACLGKFDPDEAFACGLLCQIGRLALAEIGSRVAPAAAADASVPAPQGASPPNTVPIDPYDLTAEMMADWHMPEIFRDAVRAQKDLDAADLDIGSRVHHFARVLALAASIARILQRSTVYRETVAQLLMDATQLGISPTAYHDVFDSIAREWRDAGAIYSIRTKHVPPLEAIYAQARERQLELECQGRGD